jgi:hypothetical protein
MNASPENTPPVLNPAASTRKTLRRLFLTLFLRGRSSRGIKKDSVPKSVGQKLARTLFFYGLFGLYALAFLHQSLFVLSAYLHAMTFAFLGMFIASSAGEVLFNKEEGDILLHRPILPKELLWAKIGVMVEVSLWIAFAFNVVGFFIGVNDPDGGWMFLVAHGLSTILEALFCTGFIVLTYQLCLRWFGREKLDGLMTTVQVLVTVLVVVGGQLMSRMVVRAGPLSLDTSTWWMWLLPPAWFAALDDALAGTSQMSSWILGGVGLFSTLLILFFAFGRLANTYGTGLQDMNETISQPGKTNARRRRLESLVKLPPFCWMLRDSVERASFLLTTAYIMRDREIRLRVFPALAPMLIMPVVLLSQSSRSSGGGFSVAFVGGYLGIVPLLGVNLLQFSSQWQAADIFRVTPLIGPGRLCHGARYAVLCFLTIPLLVLLGIIMWFMRNNIAFPLLVLPGLILLPLYSLIPCLGGKGVPLSTPSEESKSARRGLVTLVPLGVSVVLSIVSAMALMHGLFYWLLLLETIVVAGLYVWMRSSIAKAQWLSIE